MYNIDDIRNKILKKFNHKHFFDGVRVFMLTKRNKEGGKSHHPDRVATKIITTNIREAEEAIETLLEQIGENERIYMSVNSRNMEKAIRKFKEMMLASDYDQISIRNKFYIDIRNRFISALMKPTSRKTSYFLIDVDNEEELNYFIRFLSENKIEIWERIPTKNGEHFIVDPFNPNLVDEKFINCIKKDAMVLLYWT